VVIAIGKKFETPIEWNEIDKSSDTKNGKEFEFYETTSISAKYVIQDDNHIPYRVIALEYPGEHYTEKDCRAYQIDSIVVPLYPKIYLESVIAKELVLQVIKDANVGYDFGEDFVFRFYLTSSRSFKNHIARIEDMDAYLKNNILITKMPKFIWVGEFYTKDAFSEIDKKACGIVLLDATEANQESIDALIFAGYPDRCISMNENNFVTLQKSFENYRYYSNLK